MFEWLRARRAAKRLGLRDRGRVPEREVIDTRINAYLYIPLLCGLCNTRIRLGIDKDENPVQYCWRCETISGPSESDKSEGRVFFTLSMDEKGDAALTRLEEECRLERADLLYEAVSIFKMCIDQVKLGHSIMVVDKSGKPVEAFDFGKWRYSGDDGWRREVKSEENDNEDGDE